MRHTCAVLIVLAVLTAAAAAWGAQPQFQSEFIFLSDPERPSCHASSVIQCPNGDLLCAWYAGSGEGQANVAVVASRKAVGATSWARRVVVADTPDRPEGNPVLWADPTGTVWLFFVTQTGDGWVTAQPKFKTSTDNGQTWSETRLLSEVAPEAEIGWMYRNHPIALSNGTWLLPMYDERDWTSMVLLSADQGATWQMSSVIALGGGYKNDVIQPSVIQRSDGTLYAVMRKGPRPTYIHESYSYDGGWTWTRPQSTGLPNPNAAVEMIRLRNGHLLLAYNDSSMERYPLTVAISANEGRSWTVKRDVETAQGEYSYPSLCESSDGMIHLTYTWQRQRMAHAVFNEEWVLGHALEAPVVNVLIPNGGEFWGGSHAVAWTANDPDGPITRLLADVLVSTDGGGSWSAVASGVPNAFGLFGVAPFDTRRYVNSPQCLVKVQVSDADGQVGEDVCDGLFGIDNGAPYTARQTPGPGAVGVPVDTSIALQVRDDGAGVDPDTIAVSVNGVEVTGSCTIAPVSLGYSVSYTPAQPFQSGQVVTVGVDATDESDPPNTMQHQEYSFRVGPPPVTVLSSGYVMPASGTHTTTFTYRVKYWDTGNRAPDSVWCAIWWRSRSRAFWYRMWALDPSDANYVDGKWYTLQAKWLDSDAHAYRFAASCGGEWVYWPSPAGSYQTGPSVTP